GKRPRTTPPTDRRCRSRFGDHCTNAACFPGRAGFGGDAAHGGSAAGNSSGVVGGDGSPSGGAVATGVGGGRGTRPPTARRPDGGWSGPRRPRVLARGVELTLPARITRRIAQPGPRPR